ncbi:MAG: hypothetical protein ACRDU5_00520 [Mycobacterium sp.]
MIRVVMTIWVALTVALSGVAGVGVARAEPWPPSPCGFTLSPPQVVNVGGVTKVTATVTSGPCGIAANPHQSVACLSLQGDEGTRCMQARGRDVAQIYYEPYRPGATYVSTGRGCGIIVPTLPAPNCQLLGPLTATL